MATMTRRSLLLLAALAPVVSRATARQATDEYSAAIDRIRPLFTRKLPPRPGDWLMDHPEPGQTYAEYRALVSTPVVDRYSTVRVVPIGPLSGGQRDVLDVTLDVMTPFFGLPLVTDSPVRLEDVPASARRTNASSGSLQLLTPYLLDEVLRQRRRSSDAAVLGITAIDLWPGRGWNFVFGQASLRERVGVWSMARNGDPDGGALARRSCAMRTAMTATHETGHMLGIRHCTQYECGMNGSNSVEERDGQPLEFCPECQPKLWWTLKLDPLERSRTLEAVSRRHGMDRWAADFSRQSMALRVRG